MDEFNTFHIVFHDLTAIPDYIGSIELAGRVYDRWPNGGGWVEQGDGSKTKPEIDDSVYIGPDCMVFGNVRIVGASRLENGTVVGTDEPKEKIRIRSGYTISRSEIRGNVSLQRPPKGGCTVEECTFLGSHRIWQSGSLKRVAAMGETIIQGMKDVRDVTLRSQHLDNRGDDGMPDWSKRLAELRSGLARRLGINQKNLTVLVGDGKQSVRGYSQDEPLCISAGMQFNFGRADYPVLLGSEGLWDFALSRISLTPRTELDGDLQRFKELNPDSLGKTDKGSYAQGHPFEKDDYYRRYDLMRKLKAGLPSITEGTRDPETGIIPLQGERIKSEIDTPEYARQCIANYRINEGKPKVYEPGQLIYEHSNKAPAFTGANRRKMPKPPAQDATEQPTPTNHIVKH